MQNKNKPPSRREDSVLCFQRGFFLHTHLSKIILDAAPGVFSDERLDQTPWLLLVFHTGVDPGGTVGIKKGCCVKLKSQVGAAAAHLSRHLCLELRMM